MIREFEGARGYLRYLAALLVLGCSTTQVKPNEKFTSGPEDRVDSDDKLSEERLAITERCVDESLVVSHSSMEGPFTEIIDSPEYMRERGTFSMSKLEQPLRFDDVICSANRKVWHDKGGRVRVCVVEGRVTVKGVDIAAGAYTHFHNNGNPYQTTLARAQSFSTGDVVAVECAASLATFGENGALIVCTTKNQLEYKGITVKTNTLVFFNEQGGLSKATIGKTMAALNTEFAPGTRLSFGEEGKVVGGWLAHAKSIAGYNVTSDFRAYPWGALRSFTLASASTIDGHKFPSSAEILLRSNGSLQAAQYVSDEGFMPHGEVWTDTLHQDFDCEGREKKRDIQHWQSNVPYKKLR